MVDRSDSRRCTRDLSRFVHAGVMQEAPAESLSYLPPSFEPTSWSVLCGRSRRCYEIDGNRRLRVLVGIYLAKYNAAKNRADKSIIVVKIVDTVRTGSGHLGGFIKFDTAINRWYEVGDCAAREKVESEFRIAMPASSKIVSSCSNLSNGPNRALPTARSNMEPACSIAPSHYQYNSSSGCSVDLRTKSSEEPFEDTQSANLPRTNPLALSIYIFQPIDQSKTVNTFETVKHVKTDKEVKTIKQVTTIETVKHVGVARKVQDIEIFPCASYDDLLEQRERSQPCETASSSFTAAPKPDLSASMSSPIPLRAESNEACKKSVADNMGVCDELEPLALDNFTNVFTSCVDPLVPGVDYFDDAI